MLAEAGENEDCGGRSGLTVSDGVVAQGRPVEPGEGLCACLCISDCPYQSSRGKGFLVYLCHAGYHYFNTEFATHLLPTRLAYAAALLCIG
jgi:hypothetical protein